MAYDKKDSKKTRAQDNQIMRQLRDTIIIAGISGKIELDAEAFSKQTLDKIESFGFNFSKDEIALGQASVGASNAGIAKGKDKNSQNEMGF